MYRKVHTSCLHLNEFSYTECTCVISIQIKKQDIAGTPKPPSILPRSPYSPQGNTILPSVWINFACLRYSYKGNYTVCTFHVRSLSLSTVFVSVILGVECKWEPPSPLCMVVPCANGPLYLSIQVSMGSLTCFKLGQPMNPICLVASRQPT